MPKTARKTSARSRSRRAAGPILACGVDVVEVDRFQKAVKRWGDAFLKRIFSPTERAYAKRHRDGLVRLAARFAAKEAVVKAMSQIMPDRPLMLHEVAVQNDDLGRPSVVFQGWRAPRGLSVHVSLSHARRVAVACAIVNAERRA